MEKIQSISGNERVKEFLKNILFWNLTKYFSIELGTVEILLESTIAISVFLNIFKFYKKQVSNTLVDLFDKYTTQKLTTWYHWTSVTIFLPETMIDCYIQKWIYNTIFSHSTKWTNHFFSTKIKVLNIRTTLYDLICFCLLIGII